MGSPNVPQAPQYGNFGQADGLYGSAMGSIGQLANQGQGYTNNILSNPFQQGYMGAAQNAAGEFGQLGQNASAASGSLYNAGNTALNAGNQILQAGFDPENALYARTQQQNQEQTSAMLAATGVGATPYGAGVMGQSNTNFNIDWQNNQLQREAVAAGAYSGLDNTAMGDFSAGGQQGQLGAQSTLMAGQLPYDTYNNIQRTDIGALSGQQGLYNNALQGAQGYLGLANQGYQNQLGQWNAQNTQSQQLWQGLGSLFGDLAGGFGGNSFLGNLGMSGLGQIPGFGNLYNSVQGS